MAEQARDVYSRVLSKNLNMLMKIAGKSRKQVSSDIGVPYTTYTDWVKGNTFPQIEGIQKLSDYFHVKVSDLSRDITNDQAILSRLTAYANGLADTVREEKIVFEHKSLAERIAEYDGTIEIYQYDWSDLVEGEYFDE